MTRSEKFLRAFSTVAGLTVFLYAVLVSRDPVTAIIGVYCLLEVRAGDILRAIRDGKSKSNAVTANENKMPTIRISPLGKPLDSPVASGAKTGSDDADKPEVWR